MGPAFHAAEWDCRPTPIGGGGLGFNGAAVHHGGVGEKAQHQSAPQRGAASMGPPFITAEWLRGRYARVVVEALASMGPPFITAEWGSRGRPTNSGSPSVFCERAAKPSTSGTTAESQNSGRLAFSKTRSGCERSLGLPRRATARKGLYNK